MRVEACNLREGSEFHSVALQFINVSFSLSVEHEESFVDATKGGSVLEHDLQVGSLQTEELDNNVQTPEVSFCLFCCLLNVFFPFFLAFFGVYCAAIGAVTVNNSHSIVCYWK
jgi:hypothetical protein